MATNRRSFLKWVGLSPVGGSFPFRVPEGGGITVPRGEDVTRKRDKPPADTVEVTKQSLSWVQSRLREHFGQPFFKPPMEGIFHHHPDYTYSLLDREVFVDLAAAYQPRLFGSDERSDCDEYATGLRWFFLTGGSGRFPPTNMVGQAHNFAGKHVYNVVVCADGTVLDWEPQTGTVASESTAPASYYKFKNGILYL